MSDVIDNKGFTVIKPFAFWTQHVLPTVYGDEISYAETLDKVVKLLNELIENNNKLPDYIQQIVEEYITGGPLEEVLSSILANFILNVKYPPTGITPAKGDGTANDYEAIQGCIDYAANKGGGVVYFPFGKYLTSKLTLKPGVSLMGFGKYCTSIVLTGGETGSLISGTVNDCGIYNLTLDGNMSIQVNNVDVVTLTGYNIQLMNDILTDGYTLFNIEKTGDNIEVNNVEFRYAVESMLRIGGTVGSVNADNVTFGSLSTISGVAAIISDSDNDVITGIVSNKVLPLFAELDGNNNVLKGKVSSTNLISGDGQGNVYDFYCRAKNETYSGDVGETINGNKSVHISGMSTWAVDNNSTESVDGTKSELVTGVSSAQYNGDRSIKGKNINETLSGKKVINATDIELKPINPLTYSNTKPLNDYFKIVEMKDTDGDIYNVLVKNTKTEELNAGVDKDEITKCNLSIYPTYIGDADEYTNIVCAETNLLPKFALAGNVGDAKNIVDFSFINEAELAINSAFFNTSNNTLLGINIIDGNIITNDNTFDYGETTPTCCLCIDNSGKLSYAITKNTSGEQLVASGYKYVIQGAYPLIVDGAQFYKGKDDELNSWSAIGQKTDGSYVLLAGQRNTLSCGIHKKDLIQKFLDLGCTFAYMFDGGGSVCLSSNCVNLLGANDDNEYRKIPAYLYFSSGNKDGSYMAMQYSNGMNKYNDDLKAIRCNRIYARPSIKLINKNQNYCGIDFYNGFSEKSKPAGKVGVETNDNNYTLYGTVNDGTGNTQNVFSAKTDSFSTALGTLGHFYTVAKSVTTWTDIKSGLYFVPNSAKHSDMQDGDYLVYCMNYGLYRFGIACNVTTPPVFYKFLIDSSGTKIYNW